MKFRPLHDRVVVKRLDGEEKTASGIIIPDTAQEKPMQGKIIEVGNGARDDNGKIIPLDVKKGDKVLFGKWSGTEVKIDNDDYLIMKESDIMGIITSTKKNSLFSSLRTVFSISEVVMTCSFMLSGSWLFKKILAISIFVLGMGVEVGNVKYFWLKNFQPKNFFQFFLGETFFSRAIFLRKSFRK